MKQRKSLRDLTLLDRFLFSEAMEDPEIMRIMLEIILGEEIVLKHLPQTEREEKNSPLYRYVKLDVWAQDMRDTVYDTEVQKENTGNLPRRGRYYQSMIDSKMLEPGEIDFNALNDVFIITIAPFDLFSQGKYCYTFRMRCDESFETLLNDGAVRIFLNTHGTDREEVRPELIELLQYIENTNDSTNRESKHESIREMQRRVEAIKASEEVGVRYMQAWEERVMERREAREEGEIIKLISWIMKKLEKGQTIEKIAEDLLESPERIHKISEIIKQNPTSQPEQIYELLNGE